MKTLEWVKGEFKKPGTRRGTIVLLIICFILFRACAADDAYRNRAEELFNQEPIDGLIFNWCEKFPLANPEAINSYLPFYKEPSKESDIATSVKTCEPLGVPMKVMEKKEVEGEPWVLLRWKDGEVKRWGWQEEDNI